MGLYAENYWRLMRLFGPQRLDVGSYLSDVGDDLDLRLDLIERHPYTLELKLSYLFHDAHSGRPDPSAHVRVYLDSRQAEVTACYAASRVEDVVGRHADARAVYGHRLQMNAFLGKWLEYLGERGHSRFTLRPAGPIAAAG
jgi:uncharacterized protein YqiB (DUF1249 family)